MLPSSLNNWARSMMDLGKLEKAKSFWKKALKLDAHHLESNYNYGLLQWQNSIISDEELLNN